MSTATRPFPTSTPTGYGLIDRQGKVIVPPTLRRLFEFHEGLAAAEVAGAAGLQIGFLDETGAWKIEPRFQAVARFSEGLCAVRSGGSEYFVDASGDEVLRLAGPQRFFDDLVFSEGMCRTTADGWSGYIDREGRVVIPHRHVTGGHFSEGVAAVCGDKPNEDVPFGYLDKHGDWVIPPRFERAWCFQAGVAAVVSSLREVDGPFLRQLKRDGAFKELRGKWGLVGKHGEYVCLPSFAYSETELATSMAFVGDEVFGPGGRFSAEGLAMVRNDKKKWGFLAADGSLAIEPGYEKVGQFSEGLAAVQKRQRKGPALWGFVDRTGAVTITPKFPRALWPLVRFSEGLCPVGILMPPDSAAEFRAAGVFSDALYGFIDTRGEWVIEPRFAYAYAFRDGLARVVTPRGDAYVDATGELVWASR